jgi:hypothetical protein
MPEPDDGGGQSTEPEGIDRKQLEAVYRSEAPRLKRLLKRKIWIEDDRNDIVQEAFTRLAESKSGAASQNPGAYLQGIVRHLLADRVRRWAMGTIACHIGCGDRSRVAWTRCGGRDKPDARALPRCRRYSPAENA